MKRFVFLLCVLFASVAFCERLTLPGEIAYYPMQEGEEMEVRDLSGQQENGKIYRTFWNTCEGVNVLDFGGMSSNRQAAVDFPAFNFDGEFSIAIWVNAYWWKDTWAPIFYKDDKSFGIRNNRNNPGQLVFLIRDPNNTRASTLVSNTILMPRHWYHVVVTFKPGKYMRIYLNGILDAEKTVYAPNSVTTNDKRCVIGGAVKPGKNAVDYYAGLVLNLHLFNRALENDEVGLLYNSENIFSVQRSGEETVFPEDGDIVAKVGDSLELFQSGALRVHNSRGGSCRLDSSYSYPKEPTMGFNYLSASPMEGTESSWTPAVTATSDDGLTLQAKGSTLELTREIKLLEDGRIRIRETFHNPTKEDQAVLFEHSLTPSMPISTWALGGEEDIYTVSDDRILPSNPTGFMTSESNGGFAWVAEDDIFRCHQTVAAQKRDDKRHRFNFGSRRIGVPSGGSIVLEYTLYLLGEGDYFDFLNRLRRDWNVPHVTMPGPFGLIRTAAHSTSEYTKFAADPEAFQKVMARKQMNVITLNPWFNYWDGCVFYTREEYKENMQKAMPIIRKANPKAKFLASLETYVFCLHEEDLAQVPAPADFSWEKVTKGTNDRVLSSVWKDSLTLDASGRLVLYPATPVPIKKGERPLRPSLHVMVHPVIGNHFFKTRMEEYDFLINEVGLDGIYQDMFGFSGAGSIIYSQWDGFSVTIQPNGKIGRKFAHLGPLTAPARAIWIRKILDMKKIALTNFGAPSTREMQTLPYINFCEAAGRNLARQDLDGIPPMATGCVMNHLSTPLAYGPHKSEEIDGPRLMKRLRAYLRHGCLYVHTSFRNRCPEEGSTSAEYGPVNHMFPMTTQELHRGWVKGDERIVSCVSYTTTWNRQERPVPLRFDELGRQCDTGDAVSISGEPGNWEIRVKIDDWKEFLILE